MKFTKESLKWPQLDFAFRHIYDNNLYKPNSWIIEFGTGSGNSLIKICEYLRNNDWHDVQVISIDSFEGLPEEDSNVQLFDKYKAGNYKFDYEYVKEYVKKRVGGWPYGINYFIWKYKFDELQNNICTDLIENLLMVHIDCDLYSSTKEALDWLFGNKLVKPGCLFAFDEFQSTKSFLDGGESLAWLECEEKYLFKSKSIFHSIYDDKDTEQEITQVVTKVEKFYDKGC